MENIHRAVRGAKILAKGTKTFITHALKKETYTRENLLRLTKKYKREIFYSFCLIAAVILLIPLFTYVWFAGDLKDKDNILNRSKTGVTLLDEEGVPFFSFYQPKQITYIALSEVPEHMQQAVISAEDKNFYTNSGFSIRGIARAFVANITAGKIVEGGSTITQELVKNALLSSERSFLRKYQEIVLAAELNRRYSKKDILEMYLNSVYFGEGAFGIENAAQAYFGIPARDLTLAQSTLLVGLLPAPSAYSPLSNDPDIAKRRQAVVVGEMVEDKAITQEEADLIKEAPLVYNPSPKEDSNILAHHFALYVKDYLIEKYGEERIIRDGFKVRTSLNSTWQEYAERAVRNQVAGLGINTTNGAAVAIDPKTGAIKIMVGSHNWDDEENGKINMTLRPRQPGSSFKPLIYADAIDRHLITPATILSDEETVFPGNYKPKNYDKRTRGPVTARRALANSLNIPAVEVMQKVGVDSGLDFAKKLGITSLKKSSDYGLSLVLGTGEVELLELTNAYAVFANLGRYNEPNPILEIKNKYDKTIYESKPKDKKVLDEGVAFLISSILSDNSARAESFGGLLTISRPAAVKTGTTEDYRDALTVGYTPSLVVGVWVGNNDNSPMDNIAGSLGAAPIWRSLMENFLAGTRVERFEKPFSVVNLMVCPYRGLQDRNATASAYQEFFLAGTEPDDGCGSPTSTKKSSPTRKPTDKKASPTPTAKPTDEPDPTEEPTETPEPTETFLPDESPTLIPVPSL